VSTYILHGTPRDTNLRELAQKVGTVATDELFLSKLGMRFRAAPALHESPSDTNGARRKKIYNPYIVKQKP